jgi:hypothetical protein
MFTNSKIGLAFVVFCSLLGCSSGAPDASPPNDPDPAAKLAFTRDADGWIRFNNTAVAKIELIDPITRTVTGARDSDGACEVASTGEMSSASGPQYEEDLAFNPVTCERVTIRGGITAESVATLDAMAAASAQANADDATTSDQAAPADGHAMAAAAVIYTHSAYVKTAWIDPVNITITSLSNNLDWNAALDLRALEVAYKFRYDGWSMNPVRPTLTWSWGPDWGASSSHEQFRNTDFERIIVALFGPAGFAACGFNGSPAVFTHNVTNYGHRNGVDAFAWNDTAKGGCVNLVHHRAWHGAGHSN